MLILQNDAFATATAAIEKVSTKTPNFSTRLKSLQVRCENFPVLYEFYGSEKSARVRFANHQGKESFLDKMVNKILPTKNHVLAYGDGFTSGTVKGRPPGVSGKFIRKCEERGRRVFPVGEFRSSMLCSVQKKEMHHPPQRMVEIPNSTNWETKKAKYYCRRVNGLYQSSSSGRSILWNRDNNAARNILINFYEKYNTGLVLLEFRRDYKAESKPKSCGYKYSFGHKIYSKPVGKDRSYSTKRLGGFRRWQS